MLLEFFILSPGRPLAAPLLMILMKCGVAMQLSLAHCSTLGSTRVGSQLLPLYAMAAKSGCHWLLHSSTYECDFLAFGIVEVLYFVLTRNALKFCRLSLIPACYVEWECLEFLEVNVFSRC